MRGIANRYLSETMVNKAKSITNSSKTYKCLNDKTLKIEVPDLEKSIKRLEKQEKNFVITTTLGIMCMAIFVIMHFIIYIKKYNVTDKLMLPIICIGAIGVFLIFIHYCLHIQYETLDNSINRLWFMFNFANSEGEVAIKIDEIHNELSLNFVDKYEVDRDEITLICTIISDAADNQDADILIKLTQDEVNDSNIIVYKKAA